MRTQRSDRVSRRCWPLSKLIKKAEARRRIAMNHPGSALDTSFDGPKTGLKTRRICLLVSYRPLAPILIRPLTALRPVKGRI